MSAERTSYEVDYQGVALLRLERPEARNAIDTQMLVEMLEHLALARDDDSVRVLAISSSDQMGLSAGADVKESLDEEGKVRRMQLFADLYDAIVAFPKPTVAACHGDVVGGGAEIAVACDMRVGGANLRMRFPGAALGVPVGPARLVTLCGLAAAKYLLLTSQGDPCVLAWDAAPGTRDAARVPWPESGIVDFTNPDFVRLAESFGMPAWRCEAIGDVGRHLRHALTLDKPSLIVVPIDYSENTRVLVDELRDRPPLTSATPGPVA